MSYVLVKRGRPSGVLPSLRHAKCKKEWRQPGRRSGPTASRISIVRTAAVSRTVGPVQFEYKYPGADPRTKRKVCEMAMNGTGLAHQWYS